MAATADLFRTVRWGNGLFCPRCGGGDIVRYCRYQGHVRRYTCKGRRRTFNDKTGTILHYRHVRMGDWMLALWMLLCGSPNGVSISHIAESVGCTYRSTYYMIRRMMDKIRNLPEGILSETCETDEGYIRTGFKGAPLAGNGEERTIPSRRGLPHDPGRGTFEKNTPMMAACHRRATEDEPGLTIFEVPAGDGKTLAGRAAEKFEREPGVITDEHTAYKSPGEAGYDHSTVNHGEGGLRLKGSRRNPHQQPLVQGGPAQMVVEKTPWRQQVVPEIVRQAVPVRPQPPPLRRQRKVPGGAGRNTGPVPGAAGLIPSRPPRTMPIKS